jgi:hypothetical protein
MLLKNRSSSHYYHNHNCNHNSIKTTQGPYQINMDAAMSMAPNHPFLAPSDFNDPAGMMWMVLALTGLHEDAPPNADNLDATQEAIAYRIAVNEAIRIFSPYSSHFTYSITQAEAQERHNAAMRLMNTRQGYHRVANTPPDIAIMSKYFCVVFTQFYQQIILHPVQTPSDPFSVYGMETAVTGVMRELLQDGIGEMAKMCFQETISKGQFVLRVCLAIEDYVQCKMGRPAFQGMAFRHSIGDHVVDLIRHSLRDYVHAMVSYFYDDVGFGTEHVLDVDSPAVDPCLDELYVRLGLFFSFQSPLLEEFLPEQDVNIPEHNVPEHIANHDFAQYDDDDWFEHEYELFDGQDVLLGPEHATLNDSSIPVEASEDSDLHCGLCGGTETPLRELKVCGHDFCEDYLSNQLQAQHECRYRCALCRAEFFPQDAA